MAIRTFISKDRKGIFRIVKQLHPKWFDDVAFKKSIPRDLKKHRGFVAVNKKQIVGFLTYAQLKKALKISWMGVARGFERRGIGSALIQKLEEKARALKIRKIQVETLSRKTPYKPYESTRAFYKKMGFKLKGTKRIFSKAAVMVQ